MPEYLSPDIYIEEINTGDRPIEAVGTSTPGFIGVAPKADAFVNEVRAVNNWSEFLREFASDPSMTAEQSRAAFKSTDLSHAVFGFFQNGGRRCYVVNVGTGGLVSAGLDRFETIDEIAIVAAPGYADPDSYDALLTHCEKLKDRVAILDPPAAPVKVEQLKEVATAGAGPATPRGRRGAGAAATEAAGGEGEPTPPTGGAKPRASEYGYGAFYYPRIVVRDPLSVAGDRVTVAPSGHIAGIYARTDAARGVQKAPANETIRGALDVAVRVTREDQGVLNPAGVNCIRWFPTEGVRLWGARTLATLPEWRYVPVRRLFNMIEESIAKGTRWVVFEPNDRPLWKDIRRDVRAFLRTQWRDGALMGRTEEEAFFVQCDDETNPRESIALGRVVAIVGIAPIRPAEFIIFRIGQYAGGVEIEAA